mgnify:CR=1 FL=1
MAAQPLLARLAQHLQRRPVLVEVAAHPLLVLLDQAERILRDRLHPLPELRPLRLQRLLVHLLAPDAGGHQPRREDRRLPGRHAS